MHPRQSWHSTSGDPLNKSHVITLGTAGGPRVWLNRNDAEPRCGIATAIVTGDSWYLVDCGMGVYRQIRKAGLDITKLAGIFITHLHSDHIVDLNSILTLAFPDFEKQIRQIPIYGPGDRGMLPPVSPQAESQIDPVYPDKATPGTTDLVEFSLRASATDLNDRVLDSLRPNPREIWRPIDIALPENINYHPNDNPYPEMDSFLIHEDDSVRVTATLVIHPPIAPAFAFRFDTGGKSVTISGDTRYSPNLRTLAEGTDLLLHEAIDFEWVHSFNDATTIPGRAVIDHHKKSHSSPGDAGKIADESGTKVLALHHLVPGNADPSVWKSATQNYPGQVLIPNDNDVIKLG